MGYKDLPCSCGITHSSDDPSTYERYDLCLGTVLDVPVYNNTTRCKVCKEPTLSGWVDE